MIKKLKINITKLNRAVNLIKTMFKKIFNYLKPSFEGNDGKISYRRLTAFVYVITDVWLLVTGKINSIETLHAHYSLLIFILLLTGIITAQNILQVISIRKNNNIENQTIRE